MAEGVGFEPTRECKPPGGFQDRCLKPLGHPSIRRQSVGRISRRPDPPRIRGLADYAALIRPAFVTGGSRDLEKGQGENPEGTEWQTEWRGGLPWGAKKRCLEWQSGVRRATHLPGGCLGRRYEDRDRSPGPATRRAQGDFQLGRWGEGSVRLLRILIAVTLVAGLAGCGQAPPGPKGDAGPPGPPGPRGEA